MSSTVPVAIVGGGIGGLALALELNAAGIECRVFESVAQLSAVGVGINLLPHATRHLDRLGLLPELTSAAVSTRESVFFNRFGQLIHTEPTGLNAGYRWPQFSVHRGDLQAILAGAVRDRLGPDALVTGHTCVDAAEDATGVTLTFAHPDGTTTTHRATAVVGCDGIHSAIRKQLHPAEGAPVYSGYNMWRGVTVHEPILSGASMIRAGWLATGKLVVYPIRDNVDAAGRQLVNWVVEIETPQHADRDWNRTGRVEDFLDHFADWHFDWLDVPALMRDADSILEYPMVDQDPLPWWGTDRITLLGDAAHPMVPRGSNGGGQAVLDAAALAEALRTHSQIPAAFAAYEQLRRPATTAVVQANRTNPPDAILREVYERTGDRPFDDIGNVITESELDRILAEYKRTAGYSLGALNDA
ncbi:flavin-dependent oxidoreductase [Amycolatopsis sp. FDAARGOS 1241]|uniref:flavin-dependent oxidoreductase n=1 Tax=Amycolatopsis sp. FDAARGOS 1241 TaxID=2778070 RepID=UPI00194EB976|nr:flavin-dependent oxidoreductase [Amycolatopsis sp. FDAARGOS 1241]QRP49071.1 flavin-dependent oxidoreductase [Amycolatopsis sp. FDAARGOS 1241]